MDEVQIERRHLGEVSRVEPLHVICLRLGAVVDDAGVEGKPYDPRRLHVGDAVQAVERALAFDAGPGEAATGWWAYHVVGAGRTRFPLGMAAQLTRIS